jgi:regulatory protein
MAPRKILDAREARRIAYDLLSRKPWSRAELTGRLERRGAPPEVARDVVAGLVASGYIDDGALARQWAEGGASRRRLGSSRLRAELQKKGIARPLVEAAVRDAFAETGEAARALEAAGRRLPALRRAGVGRAPLRLRDYLLRRGYPPEVVLRVVRRLFPAETAELL